MSLQLEDFPSFEVPDETACISALADAWAYAHAVTPDPWQAWVVACSFRPVVDRAMAGMRIH